MLNRHTQGNEVEMSSDVANTLNRLIAHDGESLAQDWQRLRGLLNDLHPTRKREVGVLVQAAQYNIPNKLMIASRTGVVLASTLAQVLHNDIGMDYQFALWSVRTWATSLNINWHDQGIESTQKIEHQQQQREQINAERRRVAHEREQAEVVRLQAERDRKKREHVEAEKRRIEFERQQRERVEAERRRIENEKQLKLAEARKRTSQRLIGITSLLGIGLAVWMLWLPDIPPPSPPTPTSVFTLDTTPIPMALPSVVYVLGDPTKADIHVLFANAGKKFSIADPACDEAEPDWSPDGTEIVYQSNCAGSYDLAEVNVQDGSGVWLTSSEEFDELEPNYSSDGSRLVFERVPRGSSRDLDGDIRSLDIQTGQIMSLNLRGRGPVWSPDTMKLAYMSLRSGSWQIYVYDFIYGREEMISRNCPSHCRWPEWSSDGRAIAYSSTVSTQNFDPDSIWIYSFVNGENRIWMDGGVGRPAWSSTGAIAFNSGYGLEWALIDGLNRQPLLEYVGAWAPSWAK